MIYIIYKYTFPNGKVYIGQTYKDSKRLNNKSAYKGQLVYNAMNKYKTWDTEILVECPEHLADWWETSMIKIHDSMNRDKGYNRESGGNKNKHLSEETKEKIGYFSRNRSIETINKLRAIDRSGSKNSMYGKHHSEETKKKISEAQSGIKSHNYGKKFTDEHRRKMSESNKGKRAVYLIDTINNWDEYYESIKDICNAHPDLKYDSIKCCLRRNKLYKKRYKIEYAEEV